MNLPPIDVSDDGNILKLPVKSRPAPDGSLFLVPPPYGKCQHYRGPFEIDEHAGTAMCLECKEPVSLLFVLLQLMKQESRWNRTREAYQEEMKRLSERESTKCRHCGKMTRISRR